MRELNEAERAVLDTFPRDRIVHPEAVEGPVDGPIFQAHLSLARKGFLGHAIPVIPNGRNFGFYMLTAARSGRSGER